MATLLKESTSWFKIRSDLHNLIGLGIKETLISDLESSIDGLSDDKKPQIVFTYCLALIIVFINDGCEIPIFAEYINKNAPKISKFLKIAAKIFVSGRGDIKYMSDMDADSFRNKYEFIERNEDSFSRYDNNLQYIGDFFFILYQIDKKIFFEALNIDKQNCILFYFIVNRVIEFSDEEIKSFMNSDDELKTNLAFYYFMSDFQNLVRRSEQEKFCKKKLKDFLSKLASIFESLNPEVRLGLIINYMFTKNPLYPSFFIEELKTANCELIIMLLEKQELGNMYQLIHLYPFLQHLRCHAIEDLFGKYFAKWVETEPNKYIWDGIKGGKIFLQLSPETKESIKSNLNKLKNKLYITSFDRQTRYLKYFQDTENSLPIISDCISMLIPVRGVE
jgi:hypothetical protein